IDPAPTAPYPLSLHDALPIYFAAVLRKHRELGFRLRIEVSVSKESNDLGAICRRGRPGAGPSGSAVRPHLRRNDLAVALKQQDRSEEHTSELQSLAYLVCRLL